MEYLNESLFASKEEKAEKKNKIEELETRYDRKFNGFCLALSSYKDPEKLNNLMTSKEHELFIAKQELKEADDKEEKLELKIKIDYLKNVVNKCKVKLNKIK